MAQSITINISESHSADDTVSNAGYSAENGPRPADQEGMYADSQVLSAPRPDDQFAQTEVGSSAGYYAANMAPSPESFEFEASASSGTVPAPDDDVEAEKKKSNRAKK